MGMSLQRLHLWGSGIAVGDSSHVIVDKLGGDFAEGGSETFIDATGASTITFLSAAMGMSLQRLHLWGKSAVYFEWPLDIPKYGQVQCHSGESVVVEGKPILDYGCVPPEPDAFENVLSTVHVR